MIALVNTESYIFAIRRERLFFCLACALIVITVCSKCSFLYPYNTWVDAHCFITVGKSMWSGMVPYKDLFEQKGPVLYFIYGIAWVFFNKNFLGIYVLELMAATALLYFMSLIVSLYLKGIVKWVIPLLAYALYIALVSLHNKGPLTRKQFVLIGVSFGLVFWTKYTFAGFYVGWILFFIYFYIKNNDTRSLFIMIEGLLFGFIVVTLPVIIYFGYNHALRDMTEVYFYDNIFLYTIPEKNFYVGLWKHLKTWVDESTLTYFISEHSAILSILLRYFRGLRMLIIDNCLLFVLICTGLCYEKTGLLRFVFFFLFAFVFCGAHSWPYYALIFAPLSTVGLAVILYKFGFSTGNCSEKIGTGCISKMAGVGRLSELSMLVALCLLCLFFTPNQYDLLRSKDNLPQYQFAEIINKSNNPTLLNYGFLDGGFYMAADVLPTCKAFCKLNCPIPEMLKLQDEFLWEGQCEFVVTKKIVHVPLYELVRESEGYYLYRRK